MKDRYKAIIIFSLVVIFTLVLKMIFNDVNHLNEKTYKPMHFRAVIVDKHHEPSNHDAHFLVVRTDSSQFRILIACSLELWWRSEIGDSLIKKGGSLNFNLKRKDLIRTFNIDCESTN